MTSERTLAIIKPDAVAANVIGQILAMLEAQGLSIVAARMTRLQRDEAGRFYAEHAERPFYPILLEFMSSGPVLLLALEGEDAISALRRLMGATVPKEAAPGTIRHLYGQHEFNGRIHENAIHGSDSATSAARELAFFFDAGEICPRAPA